jgi:hypothetical protein
MPNYPKLHTVFFPVQTANFLMHYAANSVEGSYHFIPSVAPEDDSQPAMAPSQHIIMATHGMWRVEGAGIPNKSFTIGVGEGVFHRRYACKQRIVAVAPNSGMLCVHPKDGEIWGRGAVVIPEGETLILPPRDCIERFLIVARGAAVTDTGVEIINLTPLKVPIAGATIIATSAVLAMEVWK